MNLLYRILILSFILKYAFCLSGQNYLAQVEIANKLGCIDTMGKEVIPVKYDAMGAWGSNLIPVNIGAKEIEYRMQGGMWGYCNDKGELSIPLQYEEAESFREGLAAVKLNGKWGFIDTAARLVIAPEYEDIGIFQEGLCAVAKNDKWGFIDTKGIEVVKLEYETVDEFENGVARAAIFSKSNMGTERLYCLINTKGERIIAPKYEMIWPFSEGLARVELKNPEDSFSTKIGFINEKGDVIVPIIYDYADDFSEGMAVVAMKTQERTSVFMDNKSYGYVNTKGQEVIKIQFSKATKFSNGRAVVGLGQQQTISFRATKKNKKILGSEYYPKYALIDKKMNYILDFDWGLLHPIDMDLFIAEKKGYEGSGVINLKGKIILPFEYNNLSYLGNGVFSADNGRGNDSEITLLNIENKVLLKSDKYQLPSYNLNRLGVRTQNLSKSGCIDLNGNFIIEDKYDMMWDFERTDKPIR